MTLSKNYTHLQEFVEYWAVDTEAARRECRLNASKGAMHWFYQIMLHSLDQILTDLGDKPPNALRPEEYTLYLLMRSLVEVSQIIEVFGVEGMGPDVYDEKKVEVFT